MIIIKTYLKEVSYYTIFLILTLFIMSILNIVGVSTSITNLLLFIFNILAFLIFGIRNGKKAVKKGYYAGIKISVLFLVILIIINLITTKNIFKITTLIYYIILLLSGSLGGMLGINKKSND